MKHRFFIVSITAAVCFFGGAVGAIEYYGGQAIEKQKADSRMQLAKLDKQIADIKAARAAEKKAKEEKERKAAEQKASSDAALQKQLQGEIVTRGGCMVKGAHGNPTAIDVVINKKRCSSPIDFIPPDLTFFYGYVVSAKIVADLTAMFAAANAAGTPLSLTSSYRSYANQVETYNHWVRTNGSIQAADTVSARPGYS